MASAIKAFLAAAVILFAPAAMADDGAPAVGSAPTCHGFLHADCRCTQDCCAA